MTNNTKRTIQAFALIDLLVSLPFAMPSVDEQMIFYVQAIDVFFEYFTIFPTFQPMHYMLINMMGVAMCMWSFYRLRHTNLQAANVDSYGRIAVALLVLYYIANFSLPPAMLAFVTYELIAAGTQLFFVKMRNH